MELDLRIARFVWRLRLLVFLNRLAVGVLTALILAALVVAADRLVYLGANARVVGGSFVAAAVIWVAMTLALRKPVTRLDAAVRADRALHLGDRLASAIQLREQGGPWALAVADDAARLISTTSPAAVFPYKATWPARLLAPAAVVFALVSLTPCADLLGRMQREVRQRVAAEAEARGAAHALAMASRRLPSDSPAAADSLRGLRLSLVRIEKDLLGGLDDTQRAELAADLRRLAAFLREERGGKQLAEQVQSAVDAITKGDKDTVQKLRGAQEELARLEEMLNATNAFSSEMAKLAEAEHTALRAADTSPIASRVKADATETDAELLELSAVSRETHGHTEPTGIIYFQVETRIPFAGAETGHEQALRSALADIEAGSIPPGYARLVRGYFDAIRPATR